MIPIFSHYVPVRLIFLAGVEALVLLVAAYVGFSLHLAEPGLATAGSGAVVSPHIVAFAFGMLVLMTSMGLYQTDLWEDTQSVGMRLAAAFVLGFALTGLVSVLVPTLRL